MANFVGTSFTFDGETSDSHNVTLVKVDESGFVNSSISGGRSPIEEWNVNKYQPYYYRTKVEPRNLSITITLNTPATPTLVWDATNKADIFSWLYGGYGYKDFQSSDSNYIDKIIFTSPLELMTSDLNNGYIVLSAQALPYKYSAIQTTTTIVASSPTVVAIDCLQNILSPQGDDYFYPTITATIGASGTLNIINTTDAGRIFNITGLTSGEVVTINNDLQVVTGTVSTGIVGNLTNHNWFRLKNGVNSLSITTLGTVVITAQYPILG